MVRRRARQRILVTLGTALAVLLCASPVAAIQADSYLSMTSDSGDYIGQGVSYSFTPTTGNFGATYDGSLARFSVITPDNSQWWYVTIAAAPGQPLVAGTYTNAVRAEFRGAGQAGLDVYGDGRGCNTLTASFSVLRAVYDSGNKVVQFDATFEQHCEGATPALRGEIRYDATPTMTLSATVNASGAVARSSGTATVGGTVSCSIPETAKVAGTVTEAVKKGSAAGSFSVTVACGPTPVSWTATVASSTGKVFVAGAAQVSITASASDPFSGQSGSAMAVRSVSLTVVR